MQQIFFIGSKKVANIKSDQYLQHSNLYCLYIQFTCNVHGGLCGQKVDKVCCHTQKIWANRGLQICYGIWKGKHFKDLSYQL